MYLCDYEFLGESTSGLQLIEKLGIQNQSILITSRYEERTVRDYCDRLGVRLIPKGMAGFVPIQKVSNPIRPDAILIDDDSLVHSIWQASAIRNNKDLKLFSSAIDFETKMNSFDRATPLYIDSNLGNGVKGEELAKNSTTALKTNMTVPNA